MFTGLVEEVGHIEEVERRADGATLTVHSPLVTSDAEIGASIAVNGCCLTVVAVDGARWTTEAVPETLDRTNLGQLTNGSRVNLERALAAGGRLGGHVVQGHVDGTTAVISVDPLDDGSWRYRFALPAGLAAHLVEKGSITIDGISLTVAAVDTTDARSWFEVAVIPHTAAVTTLGDRAAGDTVNLEVDILAKYVEQQVAAALAHHLDNLNLTNLNLNPTTLNQPTSTTAPAEGASS